ncbi:MAG: ATP-dependent RecD-like DNA helicase [Clostridia bacterium]|nr:ATP-dependent RecD-like DNA helicase [Clostridia bacterium]
MEDIRIVGIISEIIYQNSENGYTVCEIENEDEGIFTATGYMPYLSVGETIALIGQWVEHPDYGEQFKVTSYESLLPTDEAAILKYLSSGIIAGIGAATAKNLVAHFGENTFDIMLNNPSRLAEIRGISPKKAEKIGAAFLELQSMQGIVLYLQQFNIGASVAMRVQKMFGQSAVERIKENPYILADSVDGIGFRTADEIAFFQGMPKNSPVRIRHGIKYILRDAAYSGGHTYLLQEQLTALASKKLDVTAEEAMDGISSLALTHSVYIEDFPDGKRVSLAILYSAETYVARRIWAMSHTLPSYIPEQAAVDEVISKAEESGGITLAEEQKAAVQAAAERSCMVITGGPGTGKTTIIKTIISLMHSLSQEIVLAAPTGRAAKRMTAVAGIEAKTLHRLLGMKPSDDEISFTHNESNPLTADVVIVDEASMIDIQLAASLLQAIKPGAKLILCGDADQLPSVGPGNVLRDIIASGHVTTIALGHIFRQAEESLIVVNAHRINSGEMPIIDAKDKDFFLLQRKSPEHITQTVADLYKIRLPRSYNIEPISKIQVLSPSKKGAAGTIALNRELQYAMNPPDMLKTEHRSGNTIFRVGDKVMQIKNDYDIMWIRENGEVGSGIFNGDMGIIESISLKDKTMTIIFDDKEVEYPFANLEKLDLAYAVTVHKSQGSEFPVVILALASFAPMLMYRNLLYTAVTRARDMVVIVGRSEEIRRMVENNDRHIRYTSLCERLGAIAEGENGIFKMGD